MLRPAVSRFTSAFRAPVSQFARIPLASRQPARWYSIHPQKVSTSELLDIDPRKLEISKTSKPGELKDPSELVFGKTFTGESIATYTDVMGYH